MRGSLDYSAITEWGSCLRREFVPSRKRYKPSVMDSGAAMVQRKGDAFPCLIPGNSSQADALRLALDINPFERLLANALSPDEQACVQFNCQNPDRIKQPRRKFIRDLDLLSDIIRSRIYRNPCLNWQRRGSSTFRLYDTSLGNSTTRINCSRATLYVECP